MNFHVSAVNASQRRSTSAAISVHARHACTDDDDDFADDSEFLSEVPCARARLVKTKVTDNESKYDGKTYSLDRVM